MPPVRHACPLLVGWQCVSAELIYGRHIIEAGAVKFGFEFAAVYVQVIAEHVERRIIVAQPGVDVAQKHERIVGNIFHISLFINYLSCFLARIYAPEA